MTMNGLKKYFLFLFFANFIFLSATSQEYIDAIGLRLGPSLGVTYKHFFNEDLAVEAALLSRWHGIASTGLIEWYHPFKDIKRLQWYLGGGVQVGYWSSNKVNKWLVTGQSSLVTGITPITGIEYNLNDVPLTIAFDWKPVFNIIGYYSPWFDEFSLSLKFRLN
jgi:hypothetical protein